MRWLLAGSYAGYVRAWTGVCLLQVRCNSPAGVTRIGLQDDITFIGSAAAMNRSRNSIESSSADAGHRLRGYKCGVWAPGFEQFEDQELPMEVRDLCTRVPRERHGVTLLGSAANMQYAMHVGLGQLAGPPKRLSGLRKPWRHCRVLRDLLAINMTTSTSRRRGCSWERASRTPWTTTSGWSHRR